jgi:deoxyribonuclease V
LSYPELEVAEVQTVEDRIDFPYVPGLLSFREAPITLAACAKLNITPDLVLVDGQGIAHPRRLGLASHLGLFLDRPTIGCAKSRLCGRHFEPAKEAGSHAELLDKEEVIGAALRTKDGVNPIYVSIGHRVDLESAIYWAMQCCRGYRLPEPTRLAHLAAGGNLKIKKDSMTAGLQRRLL